MPGRGGGVLGHGHGPKDPPGTVSGAGKVLVPPPGAPKATPRSPPGPPRRPTGLMYLIRLYSALRRLQVHEALGPPGGALGASGGSLGGSFGVLGRSLGSHRGVLGGPQGSQGESWGASEAISICIVEAQDIKHVNLLLFIFWLAASN